MAKMIPYSEYAHQENELIQARARNAELETQLAPLQQQFDDWAEQNRRARAWAAAWKRKAKEFRDWYFYAEKHIFRSQELSQRVKELEATNARLREWLEEIRDTARTGLKPDWIPDNERWLETKINSIVAKANKALEPKGTRAP